MWVVNGLAFVTLFKNKIQEKKPTHIQIHNLDHKSFLPNRRTVTHLSLTFWKLREQMQCTMHNFVKHCPPSIHMKQSEFQGLRHYDGFLNY